MGSIKFIGAMVLTLLFTISLVSFLTDFADDNDASVDIGDDPDISTLQTNIQSDTVSFRGNASASSDSFAQAEIGKEEETTQTGSQFKGSAGGAFDAVKNIFAAGNKVIFGDEEGSGGFGILLTTLISFLTIVLGAYLWKAWKGNPD